jgi:hypothetical protein
MLRQCVCRCCLDQCRSRTSALLIWSFTSDTHCPYLCHAHAVQNEQVQSASKHTVAMCDIPSQKGAPLATRATSDSPPDASFGRTRCSSILPFGRCEAALCGRLRRDPTIRCASCSRSTRHHNVPLSASEVVSFHQTKVDPDGQVASHAAEASTSHARGDRAQQPHTRPRTAAASRACVRLDQRSRS